MVTRAWPLNSLHADRAADAGVDLLHVGVEVAAQRLPPQPGVHEVGPVVVELALELVLVDRADQALELLGARGRMIAAAGAS